MGVLTTRLRSKATGRFLAFLASNFVQKTGQLFLLAGLIYVGSTSDVYRFGLFISLFNLLVPLLSLNIHMSIGRISFDISDERSRHGFILSCLVAGLSAVAIGLALLAIIFWATGFRDELTGGRTANYGLIFITTLIFVIFQFFTVLLRLEDRARPFATFGAITGVGALCLSAITFLAGLPPFLAAILGYSGAQLIATIYAFSWTRNVLTATSPSMRYLRAGLAYSVGTVIFAVVQWVTNYSGRWLAADWLTGSDLAAYTLIGQFLVALTMTVTTLYESGRPAIIRDFAAGRHQAGMRKIDRSFTPGLAIIVMAFLGFLVVFPLLPWLLPMEYDFELTWIGSAFVQCVAYALSMRTYWAAIGLNRTKTFGLAALIGASVNIGSAFVLGPSLGVNGLLLAAALGLLVQASIGQLILRPYARRASGKL